MKISDQFYKILVIIIKNKTSAIIGRPKTYNIEHYCKVIMKVLITGCQWNMIDDKLHYSVYNKHFIKWCKLGIFYDFYNIILSIAAKLNRNDNFYIDTSIFRNIRGTEDISFNYKIKSKRGTKVSILVDSNGIPLSIHCVSANFSDVSLVIPNLRKINDKSIIKNLIGDKGYFSNNLKVYLKNKYKINYLYPDKKNTKAKNNEKIKKIIKTRNINENSFSWLTQYRRLVARYDKYTFTFEAFILLAYSNIVLNKYLNK